MFKTIVVANDGSSFGDRAVEVAGSLAQQDHSKVFVVHITEMTIGKGGAYPVKYDEHEVVERIRGQVADIEKSGVSAELLTEVVSIGGPAAVIAQAAATTGADLIVVGSRGHSPLSQVLLGSVPVKLLQIATCPVLVVPPAER